MAIVLEDNLNFKENITEFIKELNNEWLLKELSICTEGTTIYK